MNENIDLMDILRDCPKGTKLYSTIHGEVELEQIKHNADYPIVFKYKGKDGIYYEDTTTIDGKFNLTSAGECTLFPSKDQRDWSMFNIETELVDGEIYYCGINQVNKSIYIHRKTTRYKTEYYVKLDLFDLALLGDGIIITDEENIKELRKATDNEKEMFFNFLQKHDYKWDEEKKKLVKIEPELVDGEIYFAKTITAEWIYIYKKNYTFKTNHYVAVLNYNLTDFNNICTTYNENIILLRNATEEEKRMFFNIIEKNGRKWDADKKELVRIEPKFDVSTLQPFDKVLVRDMDTQKWHCHLFDTLNKDSKYSFNCIIGKFYQCVPYNEDTKHLVGSTEIPPRKYVTWEENL